MGDVPDLAIPPVSARIQRQLEAFESRHVDRFAERIGQMRMRPFEADLDTEPRPLGKVDLDARMTRVEVSEQRPEMERPATVEKHLDQVTPQFFLRNTWRAEMYGDPDWIELVRKVLRDDELSDYLRDAHACRFEAREWLHETLLKRIAELLADRHALVVETRWHEVFGRPDPVRG